MPPVHLEFGDALSAALTADLEVRPDDTRFSLRDAPATAFAAYGITPGARSSRPDGVWKPAPAGLRYDRVRFESMRSDKDEVFRFMWENRKALAGPRRGLHARCCRCARACAIGPDGFTVRETVAEYYQVARLTRGRARRKGITLPASTRPRWPRGGRQLARRQGQLGDARRPTKRADPDRRGRRARLTPLYGGGVLIFDEYGRLKYHVHNDVFGSGQAAAPRYLWESGQLEARRDGARMRLARLSTIHRLRAIDARRFPAEGW